MKKEFMKTIFEEATYQKKEGTATSYYWKSGTRILPNRLSISPNPLSHVQRKGRAISLGAIVGQCKGQFTKSEESKLKVCKPYYVTTSIWQNPDFLQFVGYGTLGISDSNSVNGISDWGDLLIFYSDTPDWQIIRIFYFAGMGTDPDKLEEAMNYIGTIL